MLIDSLGRTIDYLRVSITDRCNLRCIYCQPFSKKRQDEILRFEEIIKIIKEASSLGIKKIRITGGEPLIRKEINNFFLKLSKIKSEFSLTTNGVFLSDFLSLLTDSGISRINISLPSLKRERYREITGGGELDKVLAGIEKARKMEFFVKINMVVMFGINEDEIMDFVKFSKDIGIITRFIEFMPIGISNWKNLYFSLNGIFNGACEIKKRYGSGPARYYEIEGATIGVISAMSKPFCLSCNRLRLTSDGKLKPCLGDSYEIDLTFPLKEGKDIKEFIKQAILNKPAGYRFKDPSRQMSEIGG